MNRYKYLDVARGIDMLLVIIGHSAGVSDYLCYFNIQLFFFLSGYLYKSGRSYGENVGKKAKRVLIPYFGYSLVLLLFYMVMGRTVEETKFSAIGVLYSRYCLYHITTTADADNVFFFNIANGAMWYLTSVFIAGLIFHLVIDKCLKDRKFLIFCLAAFTLIAMALTKLPVLMPWSIDIAFLGTVLMIVGTLFGRAGFFEKGWNVWWLLITFACYMISVTMDPGLNASGCEFGRYGIWGLPLYVIIGISGAMLCVWAGKLVQDIFLGRFFSHLGNNSIVLLSFHMLGLEVFEIVASRLIYVGGLTGMSRVLYQTIRITVSVCGCLILAKAIDMVKGRLLSLRSNQN